MKKRYFACAALLAPVLLFAGCGGGASSLALSPNWYAQSTTSLTGTYEKLEYAVTFEPASPASEALSVSYGEGRYTATLTDTEKNGKHAYLLKTQFTITGRFTVRGETGEDFTDTISSEVTFLDVQNELRPLESKKTVYSTTPVSASPSSAAEAGTVYAYTDTIAYNDGCTKATFVRDYTQPENAKDINKTVSLSGGGTFLDNETILFAMRGVNTSAAASFRTINPSTQSQVTCSMRAKPETAHGKRTFAIGGVSAERELASYTFELGYTGNNPGQAQKLTYAAAVTEGGVNTYRNVLLEMRVPVMHNLGELVYTLQNAEFNGK